MIDNYLVSNSTYRETLFNKINSFFNNIERVATLLDIDFKHRPSLLSIDASIVLSRLFYIKNIAPSTERRMKWTEEHPDCIHQSYNQLRRWTLIDIDSLNRAVKYLTDRGIVKDKSKDSSMYLKLDLSFLDDIDRFVFETFSKDFWSDLETVNSMISIQLLLGEDKTARESFKLLRLLSKKESMPKLIDLRKELNMTRDCVLKTLKRLEDCNFIKVEGKTFTINYTDIDLRLSSGDKFNSFVEDIKSQNEKNYQRLKNNKLRLLEVPVSEQLTAWELKEDKWEAVYTDLIEGMYQYLYADKGVRPDSLCVDNEGNIVYWHNADSFILDRDIFKHINFKKNVFNPNTKKTKTVIGNNTYYINERSIN